MDKIEKLLDKLSGGEKKKVKSVLKQIKKGGFKGLDVKKLKGRNDIYRARSGSMRIIFHKLKDRSIKILAVERRSSKTYKKK